MAETQYHIYFSGNDASDPEEMVLSTLEVQGNRFNNEYLGSAFTPKLAIEQIKTFGTICVGTFEVRAVWTDSKGRVVSEVYGRYDREGKSV